jgi:hypothetical protein
MIKRPVKLLKGLNLVRFAHNWNVGMLECWNHGFWSNGMMGLKKKGIKIFCRIDLFPLFIPNIPTFHYFIIPCGLPTRAATKNTIFLTSCRNSETFNYD